MKNTVHYQNFKKVAGSSNHYYITSYIGVSNIVDNNVKPNSLSTYWNPKDISITKIKTIHYLSNSGLLNMCSMIEGYINDILKNIVPYTNMNIDVLNNITDRSSIVKKLKIINSELNIDSNNIEYNMVLLMFKWRNNIIHSGKTELDRSIKNNLTANSTNIYSNYKNLDVTILINSCNSFKSPTFKETLSLFSAAHNYIQKVDYSLVNNVSLLNYLHSIFQNETKAIDFIEQVKKNNNISIRIKKTNKFIEINYKIKSVDIMNNVQLKSFIENLLK